MVVISCALTNSKDMKTKATENISRGEIAYFLHRIVSIVQDSVEDKRKREEIGLLHNDIYMHLEKPI